MQFYSIWLHYRLYILSGPFLFQLPARFKKGIRLSRLGERMNRRISGRLYRSLNIRELTDEPEIPITLTEPV